MGRVWLAFKVFFDTLFNAEKAEQFRRLEEAPPTGPLETAPAPQSVEAPQRTAAPRRSDALSLLETLQREARWLDFMQEDIDSYSDQQVGSAVREVHRGCRQVLERMFSIVPALAEQEGSEVTVRGNEGAARIRLIGKVSEQRPVTGTLVHAGWRAERCELPQWTGTTDEALILAPAEVEVS